MKLVVTIDTEEDNWARYSATDNPVKNIERIPELQRLFDEFEVRPTYLVTYPVATTQRSVDTLKRILEQGKCEIGMHCHPWNTPPFDEKAVITERDTMLCNLPKAVVHEKMTVLHEAIIKNFGIVPVSFRAGRWGFGQAVARSLCLLKYRVDTSVTPFTNWEESQGPDFFKFRPDIFRFNSGGLEDKNATGPVLEVPVTIGFLQTNFRISQKLLKLMDKNLARKMHLPGILYRLRLLNLKWLSPEMSDADLMVMLAHRMYKNNYSYLNMTFHSTSLLGGLSSFVGKGEESIFLERIRKFLEYCMKSGWTTYTLSQFENNVSISDKLNFPELN